MEREKLNKAYELDSKLSNVGKLLNEIEKIEGLKYKKIGIVRLFIRDRDARSVPYDLDFTSIQDFILPRLPSLKEGLLLLKEKLETELKDL